MPRLNFSTLSRNSSTAEQEGQSITLFSVLSLLLPPRMRSDVIPKATSDGSTDPNTESAMVSLHWASTLNPSIEEVSEVQLQATKRLLIGRT